VSTQLAVTMDELELEHAELLPSRETLCATRSHCGGGYSYSFAQIGNGNTAQSGILDFAFLNGDLSGNTIVVG
jgi:hypothetical protein